MYHIYMELSQLNSIYDLGHLHSVRPDLRSDLKSPRLPGLESKYYSQGGNWIVPLVRLVSTST